MSSDRPLRLASWNVNGVRAAAKKGFATWLASDLDVVALQEVRADRAQLEAALVGTGTWCVASAAAEKPGYSGVALLSRHEPDDVSISLGDPAFDAEGRYVRMRFGALHVVSAYMPNGSGKDRDNSRVPFKLAFYKHLRAELESVVAPGGAVVVLTDANTAPYAIDLARPKENEKTSGFLLEEREELQHWFRSGWTDGFRAKNAAENHFTWWAQRGDCRARNVGWRIDLALLFGSGAAHLDACWHEPDVLGSDHCPIGLSLDRRVVGGALRSLAQPSPSEHPSRLSAEPADGEIGRARAPRR